jgi:hypothetical protein
MPNMYNDPDIADWLNQNDNTTHIQQRTKDEIKIDIIMDSIVGDFPVWIYKQKRHWTMLYFIQDCYRVDRYES